MKNDANDKSRRALVIGYGNELRSDDALGPQIAREIDRRNLPNVTALAVHQLTPELAFVITASGSVFFVDAAQPCDTTGVVVAPLTPKNANHAVSHFADPAVLLGLTQFLYGSAPRSWRMTVAGQCFDFGETLSEMAQRNMATAVARMEALLK